MIFNYLAKDWASFVLPVKNIDYFNLKNFKQ
jgi:hypothetical protein